MMRVESGARDQVAKVSSDALMSDEVDDDEDSSDDDRSPLPEQSAERRKARRQALVRALGSDSDSEPAEDEAGPAKRTRLAGQAVVAAPAGAATQPFVDLNDRLKTTREAARIIETLATTPERLSVFNTRDIMRIAFALNNIAKGTDDLLPIYTQLLRAPQLVRENVEEYAAGLYRTPPPADGGPRPGLTYLRTLLPTATAAEAVRAQLKELLARIGCTTDDRFIDGIEHGHADELAKYLTAWSFTRYRVGLDVVQCDRPGFENGHGYYEYNGAIWKKEVSSTTNYDTFVKKHLQETLTLLKGSEELKEDHTGFYDNAVKLRHDILSGNTAGSKPVTLIKKKPGGHIRSDQFYRDHGLPVPREFFELLNSQHHLLGFNNGVLDMKAFKFHPAGRVPPNIYVSYTTGHDFTGDENGDPVNEEQVAAMKEVEAELRTFFPRVDVRTLFRLAVAKVAGAATMEECQHFFILWGQLGSNGKSALLNWLEQVFGEYMTTLDPGYLMHAASPNEAQPGLMAIRGGCRIARINEANPDTQKRMKINNEFLKRWTGNDTVPMRGLRSNTVQERLNAVPFLVVNKYPEFSDPEEPAKMRRECFIPFESLFVDAARGANPEANVYLKDMFIVERFTRLVPAFHLCLVQWGRELRAAGCVMPRPFDTFEKIQKYISETTDAEPDESTRVLQNEAAAWMRRTFTPSDPNKDCPLPSDTCPVEFSKGKPAGSAPCPCAWTVSRLYDEYNAFKAAQLAQAAEQGGAQPGLAAQAALLAAVELPDAVELPEAVENAQLGRKPGLLTLEKFRPVLHRVFKTYHPSVKSRHINARDVFFIKRV